MSKHGPDSDCKYCEEVRKFADEVIGEAKNCNVCQGWGWAIGCPGCGRLWGRHWPK